MRAWTRALAALGLALLAQPAKAVTCESMSVEGSRYTICEVRPAQETLRLFLRGEGGQPYGNFSALETALGARGETLVFAMNAGMYHEDRSPVGQYIEDGQEEMRVIATPGPGNFGLLPNGLLCIQDGSAQVLETRAYLAQRPDCLHATQSGPMLVIDGELHPRFLPDSSSRYIRNGVGTSEDGQRAVFVISENSVTFHEFARLFRDVLKLPNALFLDGNVSRLHAQDLGRSDLGRPMGPIVAVTAPKSP
ncbi:phosphodiester glycosidase family protein [Tropicibacter oceani]|uniref:phosphodiester glycosidase family protein n=1 Tax=Tropicibacter oceani TaxID=3058420 RepID=UPI00374211D1